MVTGCKATPGCIAYVGISYLTQALQAGLATPSSRTPRANYELPTPTSIADRGGRPSRRSPQNGTHSLIYGKVAGGYPIVNYEYAIVNSTQSSSSTAKNIRSVLEWAINAKYGNSPTYLAQVNFQPLSAAVVKLSLKQISQIQ